MNNLRDILIVLGIAISIWGCHNRSIGPLHKKVIDAGPFQVTTPPDFNLVQEKGIGSFVGKITNGKIEFRFDYGRYSYRGPWTYYDYADKYLFKLHKDEIIATCNLNDSIFQVIRSNPIILDAKRNSKFPHESDKEISTTIGVGVGTCTIYIFNMIGDMSENYDNYTISESTNTNFRRKEYQIKSGKGSDAGVYIENLKEKRVNKYGNNKLSFSTNDYKESNSALIKEILRTVKLNTTGNQQE